MSLIIFFLLAPSIGLWPSWPLRSSFVRTKEPEGRVLVWMSGPSGEFKISRWADVACGVCITVRISVYIYIYIYYVSIYIYICTCVCIYIYIFTYRSSFGTRIFLNIPNKRAWERLCSSWQATSVMKASASAKGLCVRLCFHGGCGGLGGKGGGGLGGGWAGEGAAGRGPLPSSHDVCVCADLLMPRTAGECVAVLLCNFAAGVV